MPESYRSKYSKYQQHKEILQQNGIRTSIQVLCFGSLGTVHQEVRKSLRKLGLSGDEAKSTMKMVQCIDYDLREYDMAQKVQIDERIE